ncbi:MULTISPECIES: flagellar biosynthetic protein FliO [Vibrio]|jgi:flagellar protein FliO/FliZ|uniref:Flagellar protein n=1 Tax=Vibrio kanaloae TaxID=170673 RepID=A0A2N7JGU3_9VIBR|nr:MULTISPECIES: flagellar biosynthetic protein FliO [Vibrio]KAB0464006.1 flagellar biosynthetic protein FliO [Vibrio kanaloae]MCG9558133.1 flagellar biosynthetic protein FliO [Vibrio kanaloae]NOI02497.1 flagellar biosynthetic protein FliO [Vibrio kanaloae]NOJ00600.1 flagellar biosynthetic protein FliO [Vibrio kanaloae]OEF13992.1 flagellar biosynthetic protein FliO [Vibrio kanaloae 5S-149]
MGLLPQRVTGLPRGLTGVVRGLIGVGLFSIPSIAFAAAPPSLDLATTFGSLIFVIAFILFIAWLLKRMQVPAMSNQQGLAIVRQIPVGTKERIAIVQAGDEQFLVGITTQSIQLISKLDKPLTQEMLEKSTFSSQLSQLIKKDANK